MAAGDPVLNNKEGSYIRVQNETEKTYAGGASADDPMLTALGFEMAVGSYATPSTAQGSAMVVQKTTGTNYGPYHQGGAGTFSVIAKAQGCAALAGFIQPEMSTDLGAAVGGCVGVQGWAYDSATNIASGWNDMWGGYFGITISGGNTAGGRAGQIGWAAEFGVFNGGSDQGYPAGDSYGDTYGIGVYSSWNGSSTTHNTVGATIGPQHQDSVAITKWHIGLRIEPDAIVPISGGNNEGILIQGGTETAKRYGGLRMTGYLDYGILMDAATISTYAIKLLTDQQIGWGAAGAATVVISGSGTTFTVTGAATVTGALTAASAGITGALSAGSLSATGALGVGGDINLTGNMYLGSGQGMVAGTQHAFTGIAGHLYLGNSATYITIGNGGAVNPIRMQLDNAMRTITVINGGDVLVGTKVLVAT